MKRMIRSWMIVSVVAVSLCPVLAQEYTLKLNVSEGDTFKYKLTMDIDFGGQTVLFSATTTSKVVKVESNGNIVMETTSENAVVKFGDQEMPTPSSPPTKITFKPNGELVRIEGEGGNSSSMTSMTSATFPDKPVKVGDKWEREVSTGEGMPKLKVEYEVVGVEKVGEQETLKLKTSAQTANAKEGENSTSYSGHFWVDLKTGMAVRLEMKIKGLQTEGAPMPIDGTLKMELVK